MEIENNNTPVPAAADYMRASGYPIMEPMNPVTPGVSIPELSVSNPPLPDLDPLTASKRSETQIPALSERIKNKVKSSYYDEATSKSPIRDLAYQGVPRGRFDVSGPKINLESSRFRLNSGTWIPRYDNYMEGLDNDSRLAMTQGTMEKVGRGLGKFVYKAGLYGVGGVVQSFNGIYSAVTKGKFEAVYNNNFTAWLDDMDKMADYKLAHYYNKEERDMNILQSMTTANFWTNDLMSGLAFTAGAMISSYVFAGAGLMNFARVGGRTGAFLAGLGKSASNAKTAFSTYKRAAMIGQKVGKALDVGVFLNSSVSWEAAVESRSSMIESEENYRQSYKNAYGKEPTYNELLKFRADNVNASNAIFAANVGILSLSNIALFGGMFNMDIGVDKFLKRKVFGMGAERAGTDGLRYIDPGKWRKGAGYTYNIVKRPISEGLYEEGLQGVASSSTQQWVESRYNPMAIEKNIGYMEAIKDGFKETYGSAQGWKEIGIGMIIGSISSIRSAGGVLEWRQDKKELDKQIKDYNANNVTLTQAGINAIRGSMALTSELDAIDPSSVSDKDKKVRDKAFSDAVFKRLRYDDEMGLLNSTKKDFRTVVEGMSDDDIAAEMSMTQEEVEEYKSRLVADFDKKVDIFTKANKLAKSLTDGISNKTYEAYIAEVAYSGLQAKDNMDDIADQIKRMYSDDAGRALDIYSHLNKEDMPTLQAINDVNEKIKGIEADILKLQTAISDGKEQAKADLQRRSQELLDTVNRRAELERKLSTMVNSTVDLSKIFFDDDTGWISPDDIIAANNTIRALEESASLNPDKSGRIIMDLLAEYGNNLVDLKNISESFRKMRDPRFTRAHEQGFMKILSGMWTDIYEEDNRKYDFINTDNTDAQALYANDQAIDNAYKEGKIGEDEVFMFKAYNHMIDRAINGVKTENKPENVVETVSDEELTSPSNDTLVGIAIKIWNGNQNYLSPRERQIYDDNKGMIDDYVKNDLGDNPVRRINEMLDKINSLSDDQDLEKRNKRVIDDIIASNPLGKDTREVEKAIEDYNKLMNDKDQGKAVDEDKLREVKSVIEDFSPDPLLPFVEQNRMISNDSKSATDDSSYFSMRELLNESEPGSSTGRAEVNAAQNPVVLMATIKEEDGVDYYEIGGLRSDKVFDGLDAEKEEYTTSAGVKRVIYKPRDGGDPFMIIESGIHSRWRVPVEEAEALERVSGIVLNRQTGLSTTNWFMVYRRSENGEIVPYRTNDTFGAKEDSIDQQAVLEVSKDQVMTLKVEIDDPYTKTLYDEYMSKKGTPEERQAMDRMARNIVIKIYDSSGRFVSVVKASEEGDSGMVRDVRNEAVRMYLNNLGKAVEVELLYQGKVTSVLPGRPNFEIIERDGELFIQHIKVTPEAAKSIVNVGYMENGKIKMKDKGDYSTFPFVTKLLKNNKSKGKRIPVVVIKARNGKNYVYPVRVVQDESASNQRTEAFRSELEAIDSGAFPSLDKLMELNDIIRRSGINLKKYAIPMTGTVSEMTERIKAASEAIASSGNTTDIQGWLNGSRSMEDILLNDVLINIDMANDPLIAPKFRMSISASNVTTINPLEEFKDIAEGLDLPFGRDGNTTNTQAEDGNADTGVDNNAEPTASVDAKDPSSVLDEPVTLPDADNGNQESAEDNEPDNVTKGKEFNPYTYSGDDLVYIYHLDAPPLLPYLTEGEDGLVTVDDYVVKQLNRATNTFGLERLRSEVEEAHQAYPDTFAGYNDLLSAIDGRIGELRAINKAYILPSDFGLFVKELSGMLNTPRFTLTDIKNKVDEYLSYLSISYPRISHISQIQMMLDNGQIKPGDEIGGFNIYDLASGVAEIMYSRLLKYNPTLVDTYRNNNKDSGFTSFISKRSRSGIPTSNVAKASDKAVGENGKLGSGENEVKKPC